MQSSPTREELWQAYDENGIAVGSLNMVQARQGALHGAVHIWAWHRDSGKVRVLLQRRSSTNFTWPNYLDAGAAGHIDYGEEPLRAAVRETNEEIGASITAEDLRLLFQHRQKLITPPEGIIDNEIQWVYGLQLDPHKHFHLLDGEVQSLKWVSLDELKRLIDSDDPATKLIPHGTEYFAKLFRAIERLNKG